MFKVQVLLSTYNGEKYLNKQVESIISQKNVVTYILIRDDGSTDGTVDQIKKLKQRYPNRIKFYQGKNLGYKKSFLDLAHRASDLYDYYAFSDQDDYWLANKLEKAIEHLSLNNNKIKLYASTVNITDENLKFLYKKDISNFINTLGSSLTRIRLAGCTYVFNYGALELLKNYNCKLIPEKQTISHDGLLIIFCQAVNGFVYVDQDSYILHRRRAGSITSGGNGIKKRVQIETDMLFSHKNDKLFICKYLKDNYYKELSYDNKGLIDMILGYTSSLQARLNLLFNPKLKSGLKLADLETKVRIITNNF